MRGDDACHHEGGGGDEARALEIGEAEDAVAARAAAGKARPEADEESCHEHPGELAGRAEPDRSIGYLIDAAMDALMEVNDSLRSALPRGYQRDAVDQRIFLMWQLGMLR